MKIWQTIKGCALPILETILIIAVFFLPTWLDLESQFVHYIKQPADPENYVWKYAIEHGNFAIGALLSVSVLLGVRNFNKNAMMNRINAYYSYPYCVYWYCAKILGIRKCNLANTPIYIQVRLILQKVFDEFLLDSYPEEQNGKISLVEVNSEKNCDREVNLILEDTYPIKEDYIPAAKRNVYGIRISRNSSTRSRNYSPKLISKTAEAVSGLPSGSTVNVFATTNPKNTLEIANQAFKSANRGPIDHLYVYQQHKKKGWAFSAKGKKIY